MDKAHAKPIQYILTPSSRKKHFPHCNRKNLATLCIKFLECVIELHAKKILIGDINTQNILFDTDCHIYLIDCDSYQIDKFPCPVTNSNFLYPELTGKNMKETMRSLADEYYAIAIFLFMLIHIGQHPYDNKGSLTRDQAMRNQQFPYTPNTFNDQAPELGRKCWESLNASLQEAFYQTFKKDGKHSEPEHFLPPKKWLQLFSEYAQQL